jgi:hypothetical protein
MTTHAAAESARSGGVAGHHLDSWTASVDWPGFGTSNAVSVVRRHPHQRPAAAILVHGGSGHELIR